MSSSNLPPFIPNTTGFTYTEPPQPEWTYRQGIEATADGRAWAEGEKAGWKTIDTATEDPRFLSTSYLISKNFWWLKYSKLYATFISGIVPRPVAFVSTISEDGIENIAPFRWNFMFIECSYSLSTDVSNCSFFNQVGYKPPSQHGRKTNDLLIYTRCLAPHP